MVCLPNSQFLRFCVGIFEVVFLLRKTLPIIVPMRNFVVGSWRARDFIICCDILSVKLRVSKTGGCCVFWIVNLALFCCFAALRFGWSWVLR